MKIFYICCLITVSFVNVAAQVAMGKWRTHFAYNNVNQIAQSENKIYAVSEGALFSIDKDDEGMEFYSKLSGLNDATIMRIEYDKFSKKLLIIYLNGNIDMLSTGGVVNVPDLYNKQMAASKTVNQIMFYNNKAYLSCDFGILVLNTQKNEVADTYIIGPNATEVKVLNSAVHKQMIYALTPTSIYKASVNDPNLVNYEYWSPVTGLPGSGNFKSITSYGGNLILHRGNKLYKQETNLTWSALFPEMNISYLNVSDINLFLLDESNALYLLDESLNKSLVEGVNYVSDTEFDNEKKTCWFAGGNLGVVSYRYVTGSTPIINTYKPKGPAVNIPWEMTFSGQKLFVVQGGRWASQYGREGIVMMFENGLWSNIYAADVKNITGKKVLDFMSVAVDPADNKHFFVTSYGTGVYEYKDDKFFTWHNNTNSTLETVIPSNPFEYIRLDGASYDKAGNLLIVNSETTSAIKILSKEGIWSKLTYPSASKPTLGKILISNQNQNQKWINSVRYTPGIFVYDDNGTLSDQTDDNSKFFNSFADTDNEGAVLSPSAFYCLVQDKNGVIWGGTEQGPFLFYNTSNVFKTGYTCSRVKIPRNDGTELADYLLQNEKIKAIAIDGANRKWIGTESSGIYLMSENGQETIHHFTVSNSPLLSNDILSIAINPVTGEVYFGTGQGIVSYQSDAANAADTFNDVYVYPNPVRENYNGVITITGLIENTQVKITDLNGNLVCQTVSNGSLATWNGKDLHGRKVNTGIYMAICVSEDGLKSSITKIMVIN